nr:retrotransposon protein, putative, Ty3-gypsy subclass [Tanacetum cinerariifolium]
NSQKACSILNYEDLKATFRSHFSQQNKSTKTHLPVRNIKQREGERTRAFATRYTDDTLQILDLPSTYKSLIEKTYTWIVAREVATNGALNDRKEYFKRSKKSSWDNNRGQKGRDSIHHPWGYKIPYAKRNWYLPFTTRPTKKVKYQTWVSNLVVVKKTNERWKLCVDFTNINKACPKEHHPLPVAEQKVEDPQRHRLKCFLDAYKGYHQITVAERDEEKLAFYIREWVFCYKRLRFGLKNAGATYQKLIDKVFNNQLGRNIEVNANDIVIKSDSEEEMLADIKETLKRLRVIHLSLNPKKCSFGVEEGIFLGHLITKQGFKANPLKVKAISDLQPPKTVLSDKPIKHILARPEKSRRIAKWAIKLGEHEIKFRGRNSVKGQILADFLSETPPLGDREAGLIFVSPKGKEYTYAIRFEFETTNNEAKYEALLAGLRIEKEIKVQELTIFIDSQLVDNQVKGLFKARQTDIKQYLEKAKELLANFLDYSIQHIKRSQNKKADALSKLASMTFSKLAKEVLVVLRKDRSDMGRALHSQEIL